jgi:hypothetical protein
MTILLSQPSGGPSFAVHCRRHSRYAAEEVIVLVTVVPFELLSRLINTSIRHATVATQLKRKYYDGLCRVYQLERIVITVAT